MMHLIQACRLHLWASITYCKYRVLLGSLKVIVPMLDQVGQGLSEIRIVSDIITSVSEMLEVCRHTLETIRE